MSSRQSERLDLRPFPMQDGPPIPWFLAQVIYDHLYRHGGQTLERLAERGGFGWDEVSYMASRRCSTPEQRAAAKRAAREAMEANDAAA